jgi:spermidine synthase
MTTSISSPIASRRQSADLGIVILFVASGASGLMLEVIWSRMLGWLLGATTWSVMTILVAFMGGLGLGGILWGRIASRVARPLRLFGLMELSIGLYTLAVPLLFRWQGELMVAVTRVFGDSQNASIAARVVAAVLALAPPTLLMGGTLPVLTRYLAAGQSSPGRTAGLLYAANTAGAVMGCFVTGCLLISWLGVVETNILAACIDLGVGAAALLWDRRGAVPGRASRPGEGTTPASRGGSLALWIATASGFCGLAYEILWTRGLLAALTDDTTYAFTLMLTAFLAGHALGAALAGRRGEDRILRLEWRQLGTAQALAALAALLALPLLVAIHRPINEVSFVEGMSFWGARIPFHLAISLAVFAPSAAFLGASFTLAACLYIGNGRPVGASTGRLYGLNTIGAIVGAIAATAWLIPKLGTQCAIVMLAVFQAGLAGLVILVGRARPRQRGGRHDGWSRGIVDTVAWAVLIALGCGLNVLYPLTDVYTAQEPGNKLLALVEGAGATVTVHQRNPSDRVISINGVNVAGTNPILRATQKLQAHLPVCLHRAPRTVLQIGLGSGGTCYSVSLHPEIESIEVAELNPDVVKVAAEWFRDINHGVLSDPRVRVRVVDATTHVATTDRSYDLILSDSTHPRLRGNAALYGRDYIANCARRLRPGGLLSTWLPLYGLSVDDIRGIFKSFQSVFPHVQLWYANSEPHENTIIIASQQPIEIDPGFLARRLAAAPVASDLNEVGISSTIQLLDFFMLGDSAVASFSRTGRLNTDDHPRLEFLAPQTLRRKKSWEENLAALRMAREPIAGYLVNADDTERARLARWYAGTTWKLAGQSYELEQQHELALRAYAEGVRLNPEDLLAQVRLDRLRRALAPSGTTGVSPPGMP